ncbi:MAG: carboxypeptidase regulatory-like domain-containing protein [Planctomycetes bacterium]|nr:carboxypeptidase regulatory-like domain-containing protein [Planctomycetota bacterium]
MADLGGGQYLLDRAPSGKYRIDVAARGFARKPNSPAWLEAPQAEPLILRLEAAGRIAGTVLDPEGNPIAGTRLSASGVNESQSYDDLDELITGADGKFDLDFLLPDAYEISVRAEGFVSDQRRDVKTGTLGLEFILRRAATLSGTVLSEEDDSPIENVEVGFGGIDLDTTDTQGRFEFETSSGTRSISVKHRDFLYDENALEVKLEEGSRVTDLVIRMRRGFAASGRVRDAQTGEPIAGAQVYGRLEGARMPPSTVSGSGEDGASSSSTSRREPTASKRRPQKRYAPG